MLLPPLLKDPLVALVGNTCYTSLIEDFHLTDIECIQYAISKCLGFGIVVGSAIVKLPQILTITSNRSAKGLSLTSFVLETIAYCITLAYNLRQQNPLSTFGEVFFMTLQNILITLLILHYAQRQREMILTLVGFVVLLLGLTSSRLVPSWLMASLYAVTIPLALASKVPQIYTNYTSHSTGQLSLVAVINYFVGSSARVFTTITELDDPLMLGGNVLASILNGILLIQVVIYWNKDEEKPSKAD
ncbi:hypothetical protein PHYBLDRAFT_115953 [Phycomyces blakesleeanus NRRL 1555(-)]|uniref:Mannose-P-dolichol utilization defect 1 protein homolog n=2 Tax=Phycomyces blakesleeanus TaxID=4837 RepID=A0A167L8R5_PHYB8|nr:hypothetical protein PHYBLDRAFT_115953 [Phycomyces blakesleeanus NRRL 1555(-)]OAD69847.1 hypothetical protein PHYBLDRAFT_115953 [Phycomyces blakesleeanus NRRL 1555(-)]|eukprot:XP_018287887.1 hypothetical protein PHYBLDRAFT_115953 [Phycomyces blakesleeanus NRRL 1555(-)]